jgi:hypothetical protein
MIGFTNEQRQRFRIRLEQGAVRTDAYGYVIPGRFGSSTPPAGKSCRMPATALMPFSQSST